MSKMNEWSFKNWNDRLSNSNKKSYRAINFKGINLAMQKKGLFMLSYESTYWAKQIKGLLDRFILG